MISIFTDFIIIIEVLISVVKGPVRPPAHRGHVHERAGLPKQQRNKDSHENPFI